MRRRERRMVVTPRRSRCLKELESSRALRLTGAVVVLEDDADDRRGGVEGFPAAHESGAFPPFSADPSCFCRETTSAAAMALRVIALWAFRILDMGAEDAEELAAFPPLVPLASALAPPDRPTRDPPDATLFMLPMLRTLFIDESNSPSSPPFPPPGDWRPFAVFLFWSRAISSNNASCSSSQCRSMIRPNSTLRWALNSSSAAATMSNPDRWRVPAAADASTDPRMPPIVPPSPTKARRRRRERVLAGLRPPSVQLASFPPLSLLPFDEEGAAARDNLEDSTFDSAPFCSSFESHSRSLGVLSTSSPSVTSCGWAPPMASPEGMLLSFGRCFFLRRRPSLAAADGSSFFSSCAAGDVAAIAADAAALVDDVSEGGSGLSLSFPSPEAAAAVAACSAASLASLSSRLLFSSLFSALSSYSIASDATPQISDNEWSFMRCTTRKNAT
mmetsp:Transcript_40758/g.122774  ORF Transcript_40758/g.122774 Transcript_40758/m.122774 type:complete len:446 (-) Transcript_40758:1561-2898(-)